MDTKIDLIIINAITVKCMQNSYKTISTNFVWLCVQCSYEIPDNATAISIKQIKLLDLV